MIPLREGGFLYRYDGYEHDRWFPSFDTTGLATYRLDLVRCIIQKVTRCGCWVWDPMRSKRIYVGSTWKKRHAWPTKSQALESLIRRKQRHLELLGEQMERAQGILYTALRAQRKEKQT